MLSIAENENVSKRVLGEAIVYAGLSNLTYPYYKLKVGSSVTVPGYPHPFVVVASVHGWSTDALMFWCRQTGLLVLGFAGTESWQDIIVDLDAPWSPWSIGDLYVGKIHTGFLDETRDVVVPWIDANASLLGKAKKVMVTGHSLGGALAQLTTMWLNVSHGPSWSGCFTFGSPRVGDDESRFTAMHFMTGSSLVNVMDIYDPAPMVPPEFTGYERWGNDHGGIFVVTDEGDAYFVDHDYWWALWPLQLKQHLMATYIANLNKALSSS